MNKIERLKKLVEAGSKQEKLETDWGYLIHHYFPHFYPPQRFPDFFSFPTHVVSPRNEITVSAVGGVFSLYWNPAITLQNLSQTAEPAAAAMLNHVNLLVSNTQTNHVVNGKFAAMSSWGSTNRYWGFSSAKEFSRARLVSAYLELEYVGKPLDASGVIQVGMTLLPYGKDISDLNIEVNKIQDLPIYGSFRTDEKIVIFYRHADESHFSLGPYPADSTTSFPVVIIHGAQVGTATFKVTVVRSFEGILNSNMAGFLVKQKEESNPIGPSSIRQKYGSFKMPEIMNYSEYSKKYDQLFRNVNLNPNKLDFTQSAMLHRAYKAIKAKSSPSTLAPFVGNNEQGVQAEGVQIGGNNNVLLDRVTGFINQFFPQLIAAAAAAIANPGAQGGENLRQMYENFRQQFQQLGIDVELPAFGQLGNQPMVAIANMVQELQRNPQNAINNLREVFAV
jgi:hypothetical protein